MAGAFLELSHVSRSFGGLKANADVSFSLERGKILGLLRSGLAKLRKRPQADPRAA